MPVAAELGAASFCALLMLSSLPSLPPLSCRCVLLTPSRRHRSTLFPNVKTSREELLLGELNRITRSVLDKEISGLDVEKIVEANWTDLDLDRIVDSAVDSAIDTVREEEGTWDRIFSGWSEKKAGEFAEKVAQYAFGSVEFQDAVDRLSSAIVDDLTDEIHLMTVKAASSALLCVQEFIGTTFSETVSLMLAEQIRDWLAEIDQGQVEGKVELDVLGDHKASLAGLGTIVGARIASVLAKKVAQGLLGKIAARILGKGLSVVSPCRWLGNRWCSHHL